MLLSRPAPPFARPEPIDSAAVFPGRQAVDGRLDLSTFGSTHPDLRKEAPCGQDRALGARPADALPAMASGDSHAKLRALPRVCPVPNACIPKTNT
jgi:hypothetical protein